MSEVAGVLLYIKQVIGMFHADNGGGLTGMLVNVFSVLKAQQVVIV